MSSQQKAQKKKKTKKKIIKKIGESLLQPKKNIKYTKTCPDNQKG